MQPHHNFRCCLLLESPLQLGNYLFLQDTTEEVGDQEIRLAALYPRIAKKDATSVANTDTFRLIALRKCAAPSVISNPALLSIHLGYLVRILTVSNESCE